MEIIIHIPIAHAPVPVNGITHSRWKYVDRTELFEDRPEEILVPKKGQLYYLGQMTYRVQIETEERFYALVDGDETYYIVATRVYMEGAMMSVIQVEWEVLPEPIKGVGEDLHRLK